MLLLLQFVLLLAYGSRLLAFRDPVITPDKAIKTLERNLAYASSPANFNCMLAQLEFGIRGNG